MADSKKYNGSTWEHSLRKLTTATDTFTTFPADVYADGNNATVGLKGNTVQNGTPTPDNPIMPQGCGERTDNLYDYRKIVPGYTYDSDGQMILNPDTANRWQHAAVPLIEVEPGATYLRTYNLSPFGNTINFYDSNKNFLERATPGAGIPVTVPSDCNFVSFVFQIADYDVEKYMFTKGATVPESYEPYGYKIPILSASTTTPVYLGEVETTRKVKKQVVTISRIIESGTPNMKIAVVALDTSLVSPRTALSTVVPYGNASTPETFYFVNANNIGMVGAVGDTDEQITAKYEGSILYYGIAETTGIVNEPLMKIGDYADTVSNVTIPVTAGGDTLSVDTTVQPSEVTVNYKGWHDATVKEWDGSQWNE